MFKERLTWMDLKVWNCCNKSYVCPKEFKDIKHLLLSEMQIYIFVPLTSNFNSHTFRTQETRNKTEEIKLMETASISWYIYKHRHDQAHVLTTYATIAHNTQLLDPLCWFELYWHKGWSKLLNKCRSNINFTEGQNWIISIPASKLEAMQHTKNLKQLNSIGFWRWCKTLWITKFLDFVFRQVF